VIAEPETDVEQLQTFNTEFSSCKQPVLPQTNPKKEKAAIALLTSGDRVILSRLFTRPSLLSSGWYAYLSVVSLDVCPLHVRLF
jgi:hypothetical protein